MGGLVGILANDCARYSIFASCITRLKVPQDTRLEWLIGGDWVGARNELAQMMLDGGHEWLWFMDDDHAFPPDFLIKLLEHDKPLTLPICLQRVSPFNLVTYIDNPEPVENGKYLPVPLNKYDGSELVEITAGGTAGMLIRREVFEAIEPPWFEYGTVSEDIMFCEKAREAGFKLYADLSARLGHITTAIVWPSVLDGEWVTGMTIGRTMELSVKTNAG